MAATYTWSVVQMDCYPQYDEHDDVVVTVHWTLTGAESGYESSVYGAQAVTLNPDAPFTPYQYLTEDQVIGWVKAAMGAEQVVEYETSVAGQLQAQINPPIVVPPLPW